MPTVVFTDRNGVTDAAEVFTARQANELAHARKAVRYELSGVDGSGRWFVDKYERTDLRRRFRCVDTYTREWPAGPLASWHGPADRKADR